MRRCKLIRVGLSLVALASLSVASRAANVPLLWHTETKTGYQLADAVASGEGKIALAGQIYTATGGIDMLVRVQDATTGTEQWTATYDLDGTYDSNNAVALADGIVVTAGTSQGASTSDHVWWVVSAYALANGQLLWRDIQGDASTDYYPWQIVIREGRAYVTGLTGPTCATADSTTCDQLTRVYDLADGHLRMNLRADPSQGGDDESLSIAVNRDFIFTGGCQGAGPDDATAGSVRAYDRESGRLVWQDVLHDSTLDGLVFKVSARGDRVVAIASVEDNWLVRSYDARTGQVRWTQTYSLLGNATPGIYDTPIQVDMDDDTVVVGGYGSTQVYGTEVYPKASRDWIVRAYDARSGELLWSDHSGSPIDVDEVEGGVQVINGRAYALGLISDANREQHTLLRAYDARSGRVLWNDEIARQGFPYGITVTLSAAEGKMTAVSYVVGDPPPDAPFPDSIGQDLMVRTYQVGDDFRDW